MLDQIDRDNIRFLLSAGPKELEEWFNTVPTEDIDYALYILKTFYSELETKSLDRLEETIDPDFTEANELIQRIKNAV